MGQRRSPDTPGRILSHVRHLCKPKPLRNHRQTTDDDKMLGKVAVESPYPLVDADPHFSRVVRYMRPSDYAVWAGATAAFPSALYFWGNFRTPAPSGTL